jgi:hypothetical protein
VEYAERLTVPLRWRVQGTMLVASLWLAVVVALPQAAAWTVTGLALLLMAGGFWAYGAPRVAVAGGVLTAGRASIPVSLLGEVLPLDADAMRRAAGVDADARAHLLLRPYLKRGVRVDVVDPDDPTPYWLLSCRRPDRLAAAIRAQGSCQPA